MAGDREAFGGYGLGMNDDERRHLEALADQLDAHQGDDSDRAEKLSAEVRSKIDEGAHHGLSERLTEEAIAFENNHPELSAVIRRAAELLGGAGI